MLLWAAFLNWALRDFLIGNNPQVVAGNTRIAIALFGWFGVNLLGLVVNVRGRWVLTAIQAANLTLALALAFVQVSDSCGYHGFEWFFGVGLSAGTLLLLYTLWRRVDRKPNVLKKKGAAWPVVIVASLAVGGVLLGLAWRLGFDGIEAHSGVVRSAELYPPAPQESSVRALHVGLDLSTRDYYFDDIFYDVLPDIRVGDRVVILAEESPSCGRGHALAVQSTRGTWIDSINGDKVKPFSPDTWPTHEMIRWLALIVGAIGALVDVAGLFRWIG